MSKRQVTGTTDAVNLGTVGLYTHNLYTENRSTLNNGTIITVRGSVIDMCFDHALPPVHNLLRSGENDQVAIEVLAHTDEQHVRGIALTPTQGLAARGMPVKDTGGPLQAPVGKPILSRMFDLFGR